MQTPLLRREGGEHLIRPASPTCARIISADIPVAIATQRRRKQPDRRLLKSEGSTACRLERPRERIRQIACFDEAVCEDAVQACPFFSRVRTGAAMSEIVELQTVAVDVVQFVFDLATFHPKVNRVGPVAFANSANVAGR